MQWQAVKHWYTRGIFNMFSRCNVVLFHAFCRRVHAWP